MIIKNLNKFFHKHSQIVLGIFALLIIFAFVISDNLPMGGGCESPTDRTVGTVFGEEVTAGEMQQLYKDYTLFCQLSGTQLAFDEKNLLELKAVIERAEMMGISLSDKEVAEIIKKNPAFFDGTFSQKKLDEFLKKNGMTMEILVAQLRYQYGSSVSDDQLVELIRRNPAFMDGSFSTEKYDKFLKDNGLTDKTASDVIRRFGAINKMFTTLLESVVVTDAEVEAYYLANAVDFEVRTVKVPAAGAIPAAKEEDLKKLYESSKQAFAKPGSYKVVSAVVPYESFKKEAEKFVTGEMVVKSRMLHPGKKDAEIKEILIKQRIEILAGMKVNEFIKDVRGKLDADMPAAEQVKIFREWAAGKNMEFQEGKETEITPYDPIAGVIMQMPEKGIQLVNYAIPAKNGVSIVMVAERKAPAPKSFAECKADLVKMYQANYHFDRFEKSLNDKIEAARKLTGEARAKGFNDLGGTVKKVRMDEVMSDQMLMMTIGSAKVTKAGDISAPIRSGDGFIVVMAVKADTKGLANVKEYIRQQLLSLKQQSLLASFQAEISRQCQIAVPEGSENQQAPAQAE